MVIKWQSISLCSNTTGQVMTDLKINPPTERMGESAETIERYQTEKDNLFSSLKRRAELCSNALNSMDNINCNEVEGSMYAFPSLQLMDKFCAEAKEMGVAPDFLYCQKVLESTGLAMVPGSGFGQKEGTYHFRTTILPLPEKRFENVFDELKEFNNNLHRSYK
jgi:alanine transaminase